MKKKRWQIIELLIGILMIGMIFYAKIAENPNKDLEKMENEAEVISSEKYNQKVENSIEDGKKDNAEEKKKKISEISASFGVEEEDAGMFFTILEVTKKVKVSKQGEKTFHYIVSCSIENGRRNEKINLEEFAKKISVEVGTVEKECVLKSKKKILKYSENCDIKVEAEFKETESLNEKQNIYYTWKEEDEDLIKIYRMKYEE